MKIIHSYIDDLKNNSLQYTDVNLKIVGGKNFQIVANIKSKIYDIQNIFRYYYPNFKNLQFFILSTGKIIDSNEDLSKYINEEALYIIKEII